MLATVVRAKLVILACAAVAASLHGCSEPEPDASESVFDEATQCTVVQSGAAWFNQAFPEQTGRFHVELTATPAANNIDAVIGLSNGSATTWTKLAAIVRFSPAGIIDVRDGGTYRADRAFAYSSGQTYWIRIDVDVSRRSYSVYVKTYSFGPYEPVARDYVFRTEQASVTRLTNLASYLEPSRAGSIQICETRVVRDDTTADGCITSNPGSWFANAQLAPTRSTLMASFFATPSTANMDGVVGFASGPVDAYNDLAASIRFATNGLIEARDGDAYRADIAVPYTAGVRYRFRVVADIPSKTFSVFVGRDTEAEEVQLARNYRFRPQQATVASLDHGATIVASSTGRVSACRIVDLAPADLVYSREGSHVVLPLANGEVLLSDGTTTTRIDAAGRTVSTLADGGRLASDREGNVYVGEVRNGALVVSSYTAAGAARWTRSIPAHGVVHAIGVYNSGEVGVAVEDAGIVDQLYTVRADGSGGMVNLAPLAVQAAAFDPANVTIAYRLGGGIVVDALAPNGQRLWQRSWSGELYIEAMARDGAGGVALTGTFEGQVHFGDGTLEPYYTPDGPRNTFVLVLDYTGAPRFSRHINASWPTGVSQTRTGVVVAAQRWTQFPYPTLTLYDAAGTETWGLGTEDNGFTGEVALGPTGRVFANIETRWSASANAPAWPYVFALDP